MLTAVVRIKMVSASSSGTLWRTLEEGKNKQKIFMKKTCQKITTWKDKSDRTIILNQILGILALRI